MFGKKLFTLAITLLLGIGALAGGLRISLPPGMGAVPVALASYWGLFEEEGVDVALVPLPAQRDRLVALQAGQVDALVTDLTSALMLAAQMGDGAAIVSTVYFPTPDEPHPLALIVDTARVSSLADLATGTNSHLRIAVPRQSDLEFSLDSLFEANGLTPPVRSYIGQDNLLVNATWVLFGMVKAGVFPQPYIDYVLNYDYDGKPPLGILSDFSGITIPPSVLIFQRRFLEEHREETDAFLRALARAIDRFNGADADELREIGWQLAVKLFFPGLDQENMKPEDRARVEQAITAVHIPRIPPLGAIPEPTFEEVASWALAQGYIAAPLDYDEVVANWK